MLNEETLAFIRAHRQDDVRRLALRPAPAGTDLHTALQQIEGWQAALQKLPAWAAREGIFFPPRLAMEQCSSELTAFYKQNIVRQRLATESSSTPHTLIDLTGGFGIDFCFLSPLFDRAIYMERQPELCRIAAHNFSLLGLTKAEILNADSTQDPENWPEATCCFIDPARRDTAGRKTVAIEDCTPDLSALQDVIRRKASFCLIKLSPMLDIGLALRTLSHIAEVHVVSVQGECKELLLVMTRNRPESTAFHCTNIGTSHPDFHFTHKEEELATCTYTDTPLRYLYEPNASLMKCGGFRSLSAHFGIQKLHPNSHLYTSDKLHTDFPGRAFTIHTCSGFGKKELKNILRDLTQANLTVRNFPDTVAGLRKRLKLKDGGDTYLFATTLANGQHVLLRCGKP